MIQTLPQALLLTIADILTSETRLNLARTSKYMWKSFTTSVESVYTLNSTVPTFLLHKLKHVYIRNKYYCSNEISRLLDNASQLESVHFAYRDHYDYQFLSLFIAKNITRKLAYHVPSSAINVFQVLLESQQLKNITVVPLQYDAEQASGIVTPERINRHVQLIKERMKIDWARSRLTFKERAKLNHHLPVYVNQLMCLHDYSLLKKKQLFADKYMKKAANVDIEQADALIRKVAPMFVEAVIIIKDNWYMITSFSVFIHDPQHIDDCADNSKFAYQDKPIAFIMRKTAFGSSSYELVIRFGFIELLADSGFMGSVESNTFLPFVGSALKSLPLEVTGSINTLTSASIFVNNDQRLYGTHPRLINQYYKDSSTLDWHFYSAKFDEAGFKPLHPLKLVDAPCLVEASSFIINSFAHRETKKSIARKYQKALKNSSVSKNLEREVSLVMNYLDAIISHRRGGPAIFHETKHDKALVKRNLLQLYQKVLQPYIKAQNLKTVARAQDVYKLKKINLFD
ncbi:uncharacterized protein ATC70_009452 [Mucor velutinosus]|uniref:F-box domain-containing protein n=1 Tax=Mucor velutinosus TaxID=708070 RepID=A0AAN7DNE9_9FUNG|nr:hypothetical protein ATC70_009452 [Mucor velutinosus]